MQVRFLVVSQSKVQVNQPGQLLLSFTLERSDLLDFRFRNCIPKGPGALVVY